MCQLLPYYPPQHPPLRCGASCVFGVFLPARSFLSSRQVVWLAAASPAAAVAAWSLFISLPPAREQSSVPGACLAATSLSRSRGAGRHGQGSARPRCSPAEGQHGTALRTNPQGRRGRRFCRRSRVCFNYLPVLGYSFHTPCADTSAQIPTAGTRGY